MLGSLAPSSAGSRRESVLGVGRSGPCSARGEGIRRGTGTGTTGPRSGPRCSDLRRL